MSVKTFVLVAASSLFFAAGLSADLIDPLGPDYPDIGVDGLSLQATAPICFDHGDTYCLNGLSITATGAVVDSASGGNELDTFPSQLSGDLVDMTTNTDLGDWLVPYEGGGTALDVRGRANEINGLFQDDFDSFAFAGNLPQLGSVEIQQNGSPDTNGQTTFAGPDGNGMFSITSFFDVFTEISLDGGNSFIIPNNPSTPTQFNLVASPEPGTFVFLAIGILLLVSCISGQKSAEAVSRRP